MLTIALPRGRLFQPVMELMQKIDLTTEEIDEKSRQLVHLVGGGTLKIILAKPMDVPTFVEVGVADLGVAGKDVLNEGRQNLYELQDLHLGVCKMVVAALEGTISSLDEIPFHAIIATTYTRVAREFFDERGLQVEIIKLNGGVEAAPRLGLADLIVDITSTGETLKENNLIEIAEVFTSSARLIASQWSYRSKFSTIQNIWKKLEKQVLMGEKKNA